jgi:hypothetical protein
VAARPAHLSAIAHPYGVGDEGVCSAAAVDDVCDVARQTLPGLHCSPLAAICLLRRGRRGALLETLWCGVCPWSGAMRAACDAAQELLGDVLIALPYYRETVDGCTDELVSYRSTAAWPACVHPACLHPATQPPSCSSCPPAPSALPAAPDTLDHGLAGVQDHGAGAAGLLHHLRQQQRCEPLSSQHAAAHSMAQHMHCAMPVALRRIPRPPRSTCSHVWLWVQRQFPCQFDDRNDAIYIRGAGLGHARVPSLAATRCSFARVCNPGGHSGLPPAVAVCCPVEL